MNQAEPNATPDRDALIVDHMSFADRLSKKFYYQRSELGIEREEFQSAAYVGLCDAAQRFNLERGLNFETFSFMRIRGAMYDLLRRGSKSGMTPLPRGAGVHVAASSGATETPQGDTRPENEPLRRRFISSPLIDIASLIESTDGLGVTLHAARAVDSTFEGSELSYAAQVDPESYAIATSAKRFLERILLELPDRERELIDLYYFQERTFEEIRPYFDGASKSWLSRLHTRAIDRLRELLQGYTLASLQ